MVLGGGAKKGSEYSRKLIKKRTTRAPPPPFFLFVLAENERRPMGLIRAMTIRIKKSYSLTTTLWIAGDFDELRRQCLKWADTNKVCITITPTEFCYHGGSERGARIGFESYPRFPDISENLMWERAEALGEYLLTCKHLNEETCLIVTPWETRWLTTRKDG